MESIQEPNTAFPFNNLILTPPTNSSGGNHFMRFSLNDNPLYIQTPKCKTKQTVLKTTSKRAFLDLTFTNENEEFIQWVENLEAHCQKYIYSKRERWFDSTLEESDIENLFTSILKPMKMGKFYLLRVNTPLVTSIMKIYDENENLMNLEDLKENTNIICILEFQGIKCSARGFQVDIEVKQILVLKPTNIFDRCILSKKKEDMNVVTGSILESHDAEIIPQIKTETGLGELDDDIKTNLDIVSTNNTVNLDSINDMDCMKDVEEQLDLQIKEPLTREPFDINKTETETETETKENQGELLEDKSDLLEIDLNLEEVPLEDSVIIKKRNDVYYEMYKEALKKAKMAKDLALSSYLEAKRIKNIYMLDDLSDDSDLEDFINEDKDEENALLD